MILFPPLRDRDQDQDEKYHCAKENGGGWWYNRCSNVRLTGRHTKNKTDYDHDRFKQGVYVGYKQIYYNEGGARGKSFDSWKEAEMLLVPV